MAVTRARGNTFFYFRFTYGKNGDFFFFFNFSEISSINISTGGRIVLILHNIVILCYVVKYVKKKKKKFVTPPQVPVYEKRLFLLSGSLSYRYFVSYARFTYCVINAVSYSYNAINNNVEYMRYYN